MKYTKKQKLRAILKVLRKECSPELRGWTLRHIHDKGRVGFVELVAYSPILSKDIEAFSWLQEYLRCIVHIYCGKDSLRVEIQFPF